MPFGLSDASSAFNATDVTAQRSLDTSFTNTGRRRLVLASVICASTVLGQAMAGYSSDMGGATISLPRVVGFALGVLMTGRVMLVFPVDPRGNYSVTTNVGSGATVSLQQWLEVDF